jgi:hypothetical protein
MQSELHGIHERLAPLESIHVALQEVQNRLVPLEAIHDTLKTLVDLVRGAGPA